MLEGLLHGKAGDKVMAMASFKVEYPRRQAMLEIYSFDKKLGVFVDTDIQVPVFVWPMPTQDGKFIVEHQDGSCEEVYPFMLTFIGSKELFDQYDWSTDEA